MTEAVPAEAVQVVCRNLMRGPTVIASDSKSTHEVIFGGAGSPGGDDIREMPDEIIRTPQFRRAVRLGVLEIIAGEDSPEVRRALENQSDAFRLRADADRGKILESLDAPAEDDMIVVCCIAPGTRPGTACGAEIPVRQRESMASPPLCARHSSLAGMCSRRGDGPWTLADQP
jgi:hypothetical protein